MYRYVRNDLIPRYGSPEILITDQGLEFRGRDLGAYLKMVGTDHRRSSPYHPQTNGKLERAHRVKYRLYINQILIYVSKMPTVSEVETNPFSMV